METVVIGCGVSGLSCGIHLQENGFQVKIVARELPPHTTSNLAAAIWYPYKAFPEDKVLQWSRATFSTLQGMMSEPAAGLSLTTLYEPFTEPTADPWWKVAVSDFRRAVPAELPPGYVDGYVAVVPLIETPIYMAYLFKRFQANGGEIEVRHVDALVDVAGPAGLIINCAGLGARELVNDQTLFPIRGQIMRVTAVPGARTFLDDHSRRRLSYIIPRRDGVILGGTDQVDDWNLEVDKATAAAIHENCLQLEPRLQGAKVLDHLVGLRPGRPQVRLEKETMADGRTVIHNYGHGGAGFTLSWGCAEEVLQLAAALS